MIKKIFILLILTISVNLAASFNISSNDKIEQTFENKIVYSLNNYYDNSVDAVDSSKLNDDVYLTLQYATEFDCQHENITNDFELQQHRMELNDYYNQYNNQILDSLNLIDFKKVYASQYGPYITYTYDSLSELYARDFALLRSSDNASLEKVFIEDDMKQDLATRNTTSGLDYDFETALADIGISGVKEYDGSGIKIGSIESGIPSNYVNLSGIHYETFGTYTTSHAFQTSSIYASNVGIANNASIYFAALYNHTFNECVDWLIGKGVNVINRSNGASTGRYTADSAYADYIVKETKVTFVISAGNSGDSNVIGSPSTGANVISVASNDSNLAISYFSSAGLQSNETTKLLKPTLTAPGGAIANIDNIGYSISGTSFSAPMVTGIVALLMDEFDDLKYHPENVTNLLCNTTTYVMGQTDEVDYDAGYGLVNYERARNAYNNSVNFVLTNSAAVNGYSYSKDITLDIGKTINANTITLYNSSFSTPSGSPSVSSIDFSNFKIQLIDKVSNVVVAESTSKSNFSYLNYTNSNAKRSIFTIKVTLDGTKYSSNFEYCSFNYSITTEVTTNVNIIAGNKYDISPTYSWNTNLTQNVDVINKWGLVFFDGNKNEIFRKSDLKQEKYTPSIAEWNRVLNAAGSSYYVSVICYNDYGAPLAYYYTRTMQFTKPVDFANKKYSLLPSGYGFTESYGDQTTYPIQLADLTITTSRKRCGYIENQYVNLSPRKQGQGEAYLTYHFDKLVYRFDINLSFWSDSEYLDSSDSTAYLQYKDENGDWVIALDLLKDITLSTDRTNQDTYSVMFGAGTTDVRIIIETRPIGTANKGRISVGNIVIYVIDDNE